MDKQELYKNIVEKAKEQTAQFTPVQQELAVRWYTYGAISEQAKALHTKGMWTDKEVKELCESIFYESPFMHISFIDWFNKHKKE